MSQDNLSSANLVQKVSTEENNVVFGSTCSGISVQKKFKLANMVILGKETLME